MANNKTYTEHLKSPEWQRKRLEIMDRDNFTCVSCGTTTKTLNVHHCSNYRKNTAPQDYYDHELITLCGDCHESITINVSQCKEIIMKISTSLEDIRILNDLLYVIVNNRQSFKSILNYASSISNDEDF